MFYVFTDDDRRTFTIAGVGGERDALRFNADNGLDAVLPVIMVIENNQRLVRAADFNEELFVKLNRGLAAHGCGSVLFVDGASFEAVRTPTSVFHLDEEVVVELTGPNF